MLSLHSWRGSGSHRGDHKPAEVRCRKRRATWCRRTPAPRTATETAFFYGRQFDDDLNVRTKPGETEPGLPSYGTVELSALRAIGRNLDVFVGVQNLFDKEYYVGFAPTTIGTPRLVNGGIRVRWSGR